MKVVVEPAILEQFMRQSLMVSGSSSLLPKAVLEFGEKGVWVRNHELGGVGLYNGYKKKFFISYEVGEEELLVLTSTLLKAVPWMKDEKVLLETDKEKAYLRCEKGGRAYDEPLEEPEKPVFEISMTKTKLGILPKGYEPAVQVLVDAGELKAPSAEVYQLIFEGGKMKIISRDVGAYHKDVPVKKKEKFEDIETFLDGGYYDHVIANLTGEVWLHVNEKLTVITQVGKNKTLTYLIAPRGR